MLLRQPLQVVLHRPQLLRQAGHLLDPLLHALIAARPPPLAPPLALPGHPPPPAQPPCPCRPRLPDPGPQAGAGGGGSQLGLQRLQLLPAGARRLGRPDGVAPEAAGAPLCLVPMALFLPGKGPAGRGAGFFPAALVLYVSGMHGIKKIRTNELRDVG